MIDPINLNGTLKFQISIMKFKEYRDYIISFTLVCRPEAKKKDGRPRRLFITAPNDTFYLGADDRYYEKDGKWYQISNRYGPYKYSLSIFR